MNESYSFRADLTTPLPIPGPPSYMPTGPPEGEPVEVMRGSLVRKPTRVGDWLMVGWSTGRRQ